ncbi:hypothetical protein MANES_16G071700v8 [Manihot esculenta]|uniref:Uncharacterized protein n=1 Tax=Manihot esculenta TaxID=3983 RepID=A0ACB7G736_MANES|nr:hypothetical protein MANES_16G071700v8 [Manihot esculenta]
MEQSEAISDFAPKKLARQLDFTAVCRASANVVLPPSQASQSHIKLQPHAPQPSSQQVQPQPLLHLQLQTSPKQPQAMPQLHARPQQVPVVRRIPHPVQKHPLPTMPLSKQESPGSRPRNNAEAKDGTPKKLKQCNCKNSRCLKLYCECFAAGIHCNGCNCLNCYNNVEHEATRQEAVGAILERNPHAFRPKIASSPCGSLDTREDPREAQMIGKHNKGCHCKKSGCLKKYSNAAINGAIGSSGYGTPIASKHRKSEEILSSVATKDQSAKYEKENHVRNSAASSPSFSAPVSHSANATALGASKFIYKSPLAGILQPQDVKEMCSLLVILSEETKKALEGKKDKQPEKGNDHFFEPTSALCIQGKEDNVNGPDIHRTLPDDCVNGIKAGRERNNGSGTGGDLENGRPASPEIDLMCHEQEMVFMEAGPAAGIGGLSQNKTQISSNGHECSEVYADQEKLILTRFRDFLNRLITCGSIKETMNSPSAKTKMENQQEPADRLIIHAGTEIGNHKKAYSNGDAKSSVVATSSNVVLPLVSAMPVKNGDINPEKKAKLEENS